MTNNDHQISYLGELLRKGIHISSSSFAILLYFFGKKNILPPLIVITMIYILFDYFRKNKKLNNLYLYYFKVITRSNEQKGAFTGATYVFLGITITVLFFDPVVAIPSILVMSLSDSASAIVGRKFNRIKINNKSLEGSIAFYFTTLIIFYVFNFNLLYSMLVAILLTIIEYLDEVLIDDNLSLPIFSAILINIFLI